ncbi:MAG: NFACT RNA binding domain-containing protein [Bacteroidota bacterium]
MQNNYYFLRQLTKSLSHRITGWEFATCFSQEKDELVLGFVNTDTQEEFYIKAVLHANFACLVFPTDFQRAKKNSVDLFGELVGLRVQEVVQYLNERCFALVFNAGAETSSEASTQTYTLLFKMHGNRSNLVLFEGEKVISMLHNKLGNDEVIRLSALDRSIEQTYEAFLREDGQVQKLFPTFGKGLNQYLREKGLDTLPPDAQWKLIQDLLSQLETPTFYITRKDSDPVLSLMSVGEILSQTEDPIEAANAFYGQYARLNSLDKEKGDALRTLAKRKQRTENYLLKNYDKLDELEKEARNEQLANILMANMHQVPPRSESVELFDFYRNQPVRIKLKPDQNAQKNAETYYRKAKNEKIEIAKLRENTVAKEQELAKIEAHMEAVTGVEQVKDLRKYLKTNQLTNEKAPETPTELFRRIEYQGFEIWVGKNAKNNDLLTQKYAFKEDLWLHARDVSGSHVIIKYKAGKAFPQTVIEKAAQLAAYYSKRRTDSLCPVIVTPKKFVRKPKGLPEGAVVIDKEEVIMVVPELWFGENENGHAPN